ncbi:hypothetical protein NXV44_00115 [Bacteroides thetaiotaomicron]|nr:hypothetical protein [Bacteroides thetaiotaomicron]
MSSAYLKPVRERCMNMYAVSTKGINKLKKYASFSPDGTKRLEAEI